MNTIDLALELELELMMVPSEGSGLELAPSDLYLLRQQIAECVLADFVDFRGISNPKRWATNKSAALPKSIYEYNYIEDMAYQYPMIDVDDDASTNSISESSLEDN